MKLSESVTNKAEDPPESANAAYPCTYVTPAYSSWRIVSRALNDASSTQDVTISFQTLFFFRNNVWYMMEPKEKS